jgi:putative Mg2+ transporter-C (MgtC) family protein
VGDFLGGDPTHEQKARIIMHDLAIFSLHIGAALIMGIAIGLERQYRQHTAGLRTNALVCVGAAMFVSVSGMVEPETSRTRMASYVVSGVGFLGGGVILREGFSVRGLATAATLWCSAAVGVLAGLGFVWHALIGTATVLFIHLALRPVARILEDRAKISGDIECLYRIRVTCPHDQAALIRAILMRHVNAKPAMTIQGISSHESTQPEKTLVVAEIFASERNDKYMNDVVARISIEPTVSEASWEKVHPG